MEKYCGEGCAELSEGESDYFMDLEERDVDNGNLWFKFLSLIVC